MTKKAPNLGELKTYIEGLTNRRRELMYERSGLDERREQLQAMPLNKEDMRAVALAWVDQNAAEYERSGSFDQFIKRFTNPPGYPIAQGRDKGGPMTMREADELAANYRAQSSIFGINSAPMPFLQEANNLWRLNQAMCWFFGDAIKAKIGEHFDAAYTAPLPADEMAALVPVKARRLELETIASRIVEIDEEVAGIDGELSQVRTAADTTTQEQQAQALRVAQIEDYRQKYRQIYREYNGNNADEIARKFRVSVKLVQSIGQRGQGEISPEDASRALGLS